MKVYVRRWNGKVFKQEDKVLQLDGYNGLCFCNSTPCVRVTTTHIAGVKSIQVYLHASEPNALVVYVEDVERKETV